MNQYLELAQRRRTQVIEMTKQGYSAAEIGRVLGITDRSVVRHRRRAKISTPPPPPLSEDEIRLASEMLDEGCSYAEVARTLGRAAEPLQRRFPGRGWSREQVYEHNSLLRRCRVQMARYEGVYIK